MLPPRIGVTEGQINAWHPVDLGTGQMKEAQGVLWVSQQPEERDDQPYLFPVVQALRPAEAPRNPLHVQRSQKRIGVAVSADQDGDVARRTGLRLNQLLDSSGDPVGLLLIGLEGHALYNRSFGILRSEPLVHSFPVLKPIRIVMLDQAVGRIKDGRGRAVVLDEDDRV